MPKLIAVAGGKHSGKTTVIEQLTAEFKRRGFQVGVVKEMVRILTLDTPAKETDRYSKAGAQTIVAVPRDETVIFIKRRLGVREIMPYLQGLDYVLLEGFEKEKALPKIIVAKTADEIQSFLDDSAVAVSGIIADSEAEQKKASSLKTPVLNCMSEIEKLADLAQTKAAEPS